VVVDRILQDALEQRWELVRRAITVALCEFEHCILDDIQRDLVVAQSEDSLLESSSLYACQKVG
jgi:hypothetical protein